MTCCWLRLLLLLALLLERLDAWTIDVIDDVLLSGWHAYQNSFSPNPPSLSPLSSPRTRGYVIVHSQPSPSPRSLLPSSRRSIVDIRTREEKERASACSITTKVHYYDTIYDRLEYDPGAKVLPLYSRVQPNCQIPSCLGPSWPLVQGPQSRVLAGVHRLCCC